MEEMEPDATASQSQHRRRLAEEIERFIETSDSLLDRDDDEPASLVPDPEAPSFDHRAGITSATSRLIEKRVDAHTRGRTQGEDRQAAGSLDLDPQAAEDAEDSRMLNDVLDQDTLSLHSSADFGGEDSDLPDVPPAHWIPRYDRSSDTSD